MRRETERSPLIYMHLSLLMWAELAGFSRFKSGKKWSTRQGPRLLATGARVGSVPRLTRIFNDSRQNQLGGKAKTQVVCCTEFFI